MTTTLITGANRGIGLELCRQLSDRGDTVIGACRTPGDALTELGIRVESGVDMADGDAIERMALRLEEHPIDTLILNAGVLKRTSLERLDIDCIRNQFEVNSLGPLRVVHALLDNLKAGAKVAVITSRMGSIGDNDSGSHYGYRMSKAAVNMAFKSLSIDLQPHGIAVTVLHPGWVRTDMTGHQGLCDTPESAEGLIARIDELTLETTGGFWHQNGNMLPW